MTTDKRGMKEIDLGPTGRHVADRLAELRASRNLTYQGLSDRLTELGWPIPELGLRRIEARARRVTVDDLLALASALNVSPLDLLLPRSEGELPTAVPEDVNLDEVWAWAKQQTNLNPEARASYWRLQAVDLEDDVEKFRAAENAEEFPEKGRRWMRRQRVEAEEKLVRARARLDELEAESDG